MPTNIDTGVTVAGSLLSNQGVHIFVMSNGDLTVIYFNGTNWVYRVKTGGSWGSTTTLSALPTTGVQLSGAGTQSGDTLFFAAGANTSNVIISKMVYNTGTHTFTVTSSISTADPGPIAGLYIDTTNSRVHILLRISDISVYMLGFATADLANTHTATAVTGAPTDSAANQVMTTYSIVGDGGATFFIVTNDTLGSTAINLVRVLAGASAYTSQTAELNETALAANCTGLHAIYDGTEFVIVANENNAKLRFMRRTAQDTYTAWTDISTVALGGAPSLSRKASSADIVVFWKRTSGQANGEIYYSRRVSGTFEAAQLLAGGASTGWQTPSGVPTDTNDTAGTERVVYITATANPFTLVEDSITFAAPPSPAASNDFAFRRWPQPVFE